MLDWERANNIHVSLNRALVSYTAFSEVRSFYIVEQLKGGYYCRIEELKDNALVGEFTKETLSDAKEEAESYILDGYSAKYDKSTSVVTLRSGRRVVLSIFAFDLNEVIEELSNVKLEASR